MHAKLFSVLEDIISATEELMFTTWLYAKISQQATNRLVRNILRLPPLSSRFPMQGSYK